MIGLLLKFHMMPAWLIFAAQAKQSKAKQSKAESTIRIRGKGKKKET